TMVVVGVAAVSMLAIRPERTSGAPQAQQTQSEAAEPLARRAGTPAGAEPIAPAPVRREVRAVHVERGSGSVVEPEEQPASETPGAPQPELLARDVIPALVAAGEKEGI